MPKPHFISDCPRCGAKKITFDAIAYNPAGQGGAAWQLKYEVPSVCRSCSQATIWLFEVNAYAWSSLTSAPKFWDEAHNLNVGLTILGYVSLKDASGVSTPDYVPAEISRVFEEAATTKAVLCFNASTAMSRLCLDMVTKNLLPSDDHDGPKPNSSERKRLFDRLDWLFANGKLSVDLKEMADAIREHGNDGAHDGTCESVDADDLLDFTINVLERVFTLPERVRLSRQRSIDRRSPAGH